jgi:hypothetical protein
MVFGLRLSTDVRYGVLIERKAEREAIEQTVGELLDGQGSFDNY